MTDDLKSIYSLYESNAGINNTTRHSDAYMYAPQEYSQSRSEQEETPLKKKVAFELLKCAEESKAGSKEKYYKILIMLKNIQEDINKILQAR